MKSKISLKRKAQLPQNPELFASLFPRILSKAERRQIQIIETAIECYASLGVDGTAYDQIAKKCGVSRTLIIHYYPERDRLTLASLVYIRSQMQEYSIKAIKAAKSPEDQLVSYVKSVFDWTREYEVHHRAWLLIYYYAAIHADFKAMHTELVSMGHKRIQVLLSQIRGRDCDTALEMDAKVIQLLITGVLVSLGSEEPLFHWRNLLKRTTEECLQLALGNTRRLPR